MIPPSFWWHAPNNPGLVAQALAPFGYLTGLMTAYRVSRAPRLIAPVPVISVGNLTLGGGGKTPLAQWLITWAIDHGYKPAVLSRGYGGTEKGPLRVDPRQHKAREVGDEPLILAATSPTYIAKDRVAAAELALLDGPDLLIMDDGHQNPNIAHDLRLVVVDAAQGFGNGRVAPAGPLRETVHQGLARADLLIAIGDATARQILLAHPDIPETLPTTEAELAPLSTGMSWADQRLFAFAGIARPEKFFETLRELGVDLRGTAALGDHQPLSTALLTRLQKEAQTKGARLVTTEKDMARLPASWRREVAVLPVRIEPQNDTLPAMLSKLMEAAKVTRRHERTTDQEMRPSRHKARKAIQPK